MENLIKITSWITLVGLVNCFTSKDLVIVKSWSKGAQGHAAIRPPVTINSWVLHMHFDGSVSDLQVWQGRVIRRTGNDFDIQNMAINGRIQANQEFLFHFIVHGDFGEYNYPHGVYYTTVYFTKQGTSNVPTPTTVSTTITTTAASHSTGTPRKTTTETYTTASQSTQKSITESTTTSHPTRTTTNAGPITTTLSSILKPSTAPPQAATSSENFSCKKFESVLAVGEHKHVTSKNSVNCDKVIGGANEDLVLSMCNVTNPDHWRRGPKVVDICSQIPLYTPVATFIEVGSGSYLPRGAQSGIFVGCMSKGFRLIVQHCHSYPVIEHIEVGGIFNQDPDKYFVIL